MGTLLVEDTRRFIVTGCARSGTGYTAALLNQLGVPCGHESVFRPLLGRRLNRFPFNRVGSLVGRLRPYRLPIPGGRGFFPSEWLTKMPLADSSWLAAPELTKVPPDTVIIHQIRNPLDVISSILRIGLFRRSNVNGYASFAYRRRAFLREGDELARCIRYWVEWNRLIEEQSCSRGLDYRRFRLEDAEVEPVAELLHFIGVERSASSIGEALHATPNDVNSRGNRTADHRLSWEELPTGELTTQLETMARRYGYLLDTE